MKICIMCAAIHWGVVDELCIDCLVAADIHFEWVTSYWEAEFNDSEFWFETEVKGINETWCPELIKEIAREYA